MADVRSTAVVAGLLLLVNWCVLVTARQLVDTQLPLSEIVWKSEATHTFVGTPSIIALSNGTYLATNDLFGPGTVTGTVHVYASHDKGIEWQLIGTAPGQYWSNLFLHGNDVYLLGTAGDLGGGIAISRSSDSGVTWQHQVLFPPPAAEVGFYATGATPLLRAHGRVWRAFELWHAPHRWPQDFQAVLVSAAEGSDLMDPASWTMTAPLQFDNSWIAGVQPPVPAGGYLEGNAVEGPDGRIHVLLRLPLQSNAWTYINLNHACLLDFEPLSTAAASDSSSCRTAHGSGSSSSRRSLAADSREGDAPSQEAGSSGQGEMSFNSIIDMPGGGNKFVVRRDNITGLYVVLGNPQTPDAIGSDQRNILELLVSPDLRSWRSVGRILAGDTGLTWPDSLRYEGFHYVDWQFEDGDLIAVIRTSYRGADSYHNSNRMTFTRVTDWRKLVKTNNSTQSQSNGVRGQQQPCQRFSDQKRRNKQCVSRMQQARKTSAQLKAAAEEFYWGSLCCRRGRPCHSCQQNAAIAF